MRLSLFPLLLSDHFSKADLDLSRPVRAFRLFAVALPGHPKDTAVVWYRERKSQLVSILPTTQEEVWTD
jgi:hypothetical protein